MARGRPKLIHLRMPDVVMDIKEELRHWERVVPAARPFLAQNLMVTELLIIRGSNTGKSNKDSHGWETLKPTVMTNLKN